MTRESSLLKYFGCDILRIVDSVKRHIHHGKLSKTSVTRLTKMLFQMSLMPWPFFYFPLPFTSFQFSLLFKLQKKLQTYLFFVSFFLHIKLIRTIYTIYSYHFGFLFVFILTIYSHYLIQQQLIAFCNCLYLFCLAFYLRFIFVLVKDIF